MVVGILPSGVVLREPVVVDGAELITTPDRRQTPRRGIRRYRVVARLRSGVSFEQARREMQSLATRLASEHPDTNQGWTVAMGGLREQAVGDVRPALVTLLAAVGFVFVIAGSNATGLLLTRATCAAKEFATKAAIGASPGRMVRQLVFESAPLVAITPAWCCSSPAGACPWSPLRYPPRCSGSKI